MIEIRKVTDADSEESDAIWLQAFQAGTFSQLVPLREGQEERRGRFVRFGLWDAAGMQASFQAFDNHMYYAPGVVLPTAYISSVAVRPAARGRGYGSAVLRHMLDHMRDSGQVFVTLTPFSYDYYRRLGWDWMGTTRSYRVASRALPAEPATDCVRAARKTDFSGIHATYARFAQGYRGMSVRHATDWNTVLGDTKEQTTYSYLHEGAGGIDGYLAFRGGNGEEVSLTEFLTVSPAAQRALLALLRRGHMQTKSYVWEAPENDGLWSQVMTRELTTTLQPALIGRVVDVAAAFCALRPIGLADGALTVSIHDPAASWNHQTWRVTVSEGRLSAHSVPDEPAIRMDIQAFSQAYMGALTLSELRKRERMEVVEETAFHTLSRLLDGPPMWACGPI